MVRKLELSSYIACVNLDTICYIDIDIDERTNIYDNDREHDLNIYLSSGKSIEVEISNDDLPIVNAFIEDYMNYMNSKVGNVFV